jgi:hypothetical protein
MKVPCGEAKAVMDLLAGIGSLLVVFISAGATTINNQVRSIDR